MPAMVALSIRPLALDRAHHGSVAPRVARPARSAVRRRGMPVTAVAIAQTGGCIRVPRRGQAGERGAQRRRPGQVNGNGASAERVPPSRRLRRRRLVRRLVAAIRDNDERTVEEAVLELASARRIFAPLALAVGAFVMLFSGLRLLVTNWRLMLVQALPAMWIWAATFDLKVHVLHGKEFNIIRGPIVLLLFAAVVLITIAAFYLNAAFAFAISQPGPPDLRAGFHEARRHVRAVAVWGTGIGLALAIATMLAPRWWLGWFSLLLGIVLAVMMVCYIAVPV